VEAAVQTAAGAQGGLASLLADLSAAIQSPALPQPVQAAMARVLGFQLPIDPAPSSADLRRATAQSGLFLETTLATQETAPDDDLKAALLTLGQALETWRGGSAAPPGATPSTPAPAPPYSGGPTQGQPALAPGLAPDAPAEAVADRLIKQTGAAISRQVLMQAASAAKGAASPNDPGAAQWLFEIPLATPQGASIAQFEIDRDGAAVGRDEDERVWRARFSLDVDPMGPVHAKITLSGRVARVAIWAENDDTLARLSQQKDDLSNALLGEDLDGQVAILPGAPTTAAPAAGQFMDKAV
jgi:hypothetical protein